MDGLTFELFIAVLLLTPYFNKFCLSLFPFGRFTRLSIIQFRFNVCNVSLLETIRKSEAKKQRNMQNSWKVSSKFQLCRKGVSCVFTTRTTECMVMVAVITDKF